MNYFNYLGHSRSVAFISVFLLGTTLRLFGLGAQPLYLDEGYSVWFATRDWHYLWTEVPRFHIHPPFYHSSLKLWMSLGQNEGVLRLWSALLSIATLPLVFLIGRSVFGEQHGFKAGLVAMLAFAVNTGQIDRAQDARPYAFWVFAFALALAGLAWLVRNPKSACLPPRQWIRKPAAASAFAAVSLGAGLLPWLHNVGPIYLASVAGFCGLWWAIFLRRDRIAFLNLCIVGLLALLLYLPYLPLLLSHTGGLQGKWTAPPLELREILETSAEAFGFWSYSVLRLRYTVAFNLVILVLAALGFVALWRRRDGAPILLLCMVLLLPWSLILLLSFAVLPIFLPHTLLPNFIPLAVILGGSVLFFSRPLWTGVVALALVAVYGGGLPAYYTIPVRLEPWDRVVQTIVDRSEESGVIFTSPNTVAFTVDYYLNKQGATFNVVPLPVAFPALDPSYFHPWGRSGGAGPDRRSVETMSRAIDESGAIWLVQRLPRVFDPDELLLGYLSERFCLRRYSFPLAGTEAFQVLRRHDPASPPCIEDGPVVNPVCPAPMTRLARSSLGCLGPEAGVSYCKPNHLVRCRLDFE